MSNYDSTQDTKEHIRQVDQFLNDIAKRLKIRGLVHDASKLKEAEKKIFDKFTPKLKKSEYGSDEYKGFLREMSVALNHHYSHNRHHPEHFEEGIRGMNLIDLLEMFCDWKAATMRHASGDLMESIEFNKTRFKYSDELKDIFNNTAKYLGWDQK